MLFVTVNGQLPGAVLPSRIRKAAVEIKTISSAGLEGVDVIVDGAIVRSLTPGGNQSRIDGRVTVDVSDGSWIAVRAWEKNEKTVRFAHTSPFYVGASSRKDPAARARLSEWIDEYAERLKALPPDALTDEQRTGWLTLCRQARDFYR